jgi:hypothetical protein
MDNAETLLVASCRFWVSGSFSVCGFSTLFSKIETLFSELSGVSIIGISGFKIGISCME